MHILNHFAVDLNLIPHFTMTTLKKKICKKISHNTAYLLKQSFKYSLAKDPHDPKKFSL